MSVERMPAIRIEPATAAADTLAPSVLWEGRIPSAGWTHLLTVMSVAPVTTDEPWGGDVWVRNLATLEDSNVVHVTSAKPHLVLPWAFAAVPDVDDLIAVMGSPSDPTSAVWVDSVIFTLSLGDLGAVPTPSDPVHIPSPAGFDEALLAPVLQSLRGGGHG